MFNVLKKKSSPVGTQITFTIIGMHCTSCAMNIDGELEDVKGVIRADTSYAQSKTVITYNPALVTPAKLKSVINSLNYTVSKR